MKMKLIFVLIIAAVFTVKAYSQWPGYFYAFELEDASGNIVDSNRTDYKFTAQPCAECKAIVTGIKICEGNKIWHFYAGGNSQLDKTNSLKIERFEDGKSSETMTLFFLPTLSGGKEKFYRDLYIGKIKFRSGEFTVVLPKTDEEWDNLKEKENVCKLSYAVSLYYDISVYQKY